MTPCRSHDPIYWCKSSPTDHGGLTFLVFLSNTSDNRVTKENRVMAVLVCAAGSESPSQNCSNQMVQGAKQTPRDALKWLYHASIKRARLGRSNVFLPLHVQQLTFQKRSLGGSLSSGLTMPRPT